MSAAGQRITAATGAREAAKQVATVRLTLPFPVSVNALHMISGGRPIRSRRYRAWIDKAGWELRQQRPGWIAGAVNVRIDLVAPDRRKRDCDNLAKCVLDLLVEHRVIEGDDQSIVRWCHPEWIESGAPCTVTVTSCERTAP